jgi:hypothetical protein
MELLMEENGVAFMVELYEREGKEIAFWNIKRLNIS